MPKAPQRQRPSGHGFLAALVVVVPLALALPFGSVPVEARGGADGWEARQIRKGGIPARDRKLTDELPGRARIGYHPETGRVRFISGSPAVPLTSGVPGVASGKRALSGADARGKARRFVVRYGELFGLRSPATELRAHDTDRHLGLGSKPRNVGAGLPHATVRFEQTRDGIAVMGGEIVVQLSKGGEVLSAAGEVLPSRSRAPTKVSVGAGSARATAARWLAREAGRARSAVKTTSEGLALYDPRLMDDPVLAPGGTRLVWRIDARLSADQVGPGDHRLVIVDARSGAVLTSIGRDHTAEGPNRRVCDNRNRPGLGWRCDGPYARSEGQPWTRIGDVDAAYRLMGVTYDYFYELFGRDGVDGEGSSMKATVRYCPSYGCPWRNAEWKWHGQQAIFGKGWAKADDIVAHEYTHGVLDAEAPLFYHYQSGAINESYADIFGELIDIANRGRGDTSWTRWKIGEDTPIGAFRDMRDPGRFGHPDRVRSPRWHVGSSDYGGVHRNSGVGNKAAYLLAAGGQFRGYAIKRLGRVRTARIFYQALTTRLTPAANYIDLADALTSACTDLAGTHDITLSHCQAVRNATRATQMHRVPRSRAPARAPVCPSGTAPIDVFRDDLEDPDAGIWVSTRLVGDKRAWYYPQNPNDRPSWDGTWASSGKYNFYAPNLSTRSDAVMRMRQAVTLPPGAFLRFEHGYSFDKDAQRRYDGAVVEIRLDGGSWRDTKHLFTHGGYVGRMARGYGNPLEGRRAFTGDSHGWSEARLDLSEFAGSTMRVRFRMASGRGVGGRGWYIDDIRIYACADDQDVPTGTLTIDAGAETTSAPNVSLSLTWDDATTWVTKLRLSASPEMNASGRRLRYGLTMPIRETVPWDLADTTFGGSGEPGVRTVYGQVRDAAGNWSAVFSDTIELLAP
jgi:hypothetical protein